MITIGFIGPKGCGKSTVVNSLIGKRILGSKSDSYDYSVIGSDTLVIKFNVCNVWTTVTSDNGSRLTLIDFHGKYKDEGINVLCDSCDIIYWVTDCDSCFKTEAERIMFCDAMRIADEKFKNGNFFSLRILLTKCDDNGGKILSELYPIDNEKINCKEIIETERTESVDDIIKRLRALYGSIIIEPYNAHGKIIHKIGSGALFDFVKNNFPHPDNKYTTFTLIGEENVISLREDFVFNRIGKIDFVSATKDQRRVFFSMINKLGNKKSVWRIFNRITRTRNNINTCFLSVLYFIESDENVFSIIDLIHDEYDREELSCAFLVGLNQEISLKYLFNYDKNRLSNLVYFLGKLYGMSIVPASPIVNMWRIIKQKAASHKIKLFDEYMNIDLQINRKMFAQKSYIKKIKDLRFKLYGENDDGDVRMMLSLKIFDPSYSLFEEHPVEPEGVW